MKSKQWLMCLLCAIFYGTYGCSSDEEQLFRQDLPKKSETIPTTVITGMPVYIGNDSTWFHLSVEGELCRLKGIAYSSTNQEPTIRGREIGTYRVARNGKTEQDSVVRKGLKFNTVYYVRAYAIVEYDNDQANDTVYGEVIPFSLRPELAEVETQPVLNRVRRAAIVMGTLKKKGDATEWGAVLSRGLNPTIEDTRLKAADIDKTTGEFGVWFDNLEPLTLYHVRAYALNADGSASYGKDRIFQTTRGGNVRWVWASNAEGAKAAITDGVSAYDRITEAMDSAMYYYNNYSNLDKHINVQYSPGTPTADCNIEGWMRFGENIRYQWVGTSQHEISHAMGVGTASNWQELIQFNNGRKGWSKPIANNTLKVVLRDMTQHINGDAQHFWNGGINQREEVTNGTTNSYGVTIKNAEMLKANALILNGMREDGLSNWW